MLKQGLVCRGAFGQGTGVLTLGLESSCDETAAAVVRDGRHALSDVIAFQEIGSIAALEAVLPDGYAFQFETRCLQNTAACATDVEDIYNAIDTCMEKSIMTPDLNPEVSYSCSQFGDVVESIISGDEINIKGVQEGSYSII